MRVARIWKRAKWNTIHVDGSGPSEVEGECVLGITSLWSVSLDLYPRDLHSSANQIYSLETPPRLNLHELRNYDD